MKLIKLFPLYRDSEKSGDWLKQGSHIQMPLETRQFHPVFLIIDYSFISLAKKHSLIYPFKKYLQSTDDWAHSGEQFKISALMKLTF